MYFVLYNQQVVHLAVQPLLVTVARIAAVPMGVDSLSSPPPPFPLSKRIVECALLVVVVAVVLVLELRIVRPVGRYWSRRSRLWRLVHQQQLVASENFVSLVISGDSLWLSGSKLR